MLKLAKPDSKLFKDKFRIELGRLPFENLFASLHNNNINNCMPEFFKFARYYIPRMYTLCIPIVMKWSHKQGKPSCKTNERYT